jgi:hypothetical protein
MAFIPVYAVINTEYLYRNSLGRTEWKCVDLTPQQNQFFTFPSREKISHVLCGLYAS